MQFRPAPGILHGIWCHGQSLGELGVWPPGIKGGSGIARIKDDTKCKACGNCEKYCPTTAMKRGDKKITFDQERCIGCGQCAFQCRENNIEMLPNARTVYLPLLRRSEARVVI